MIISDKQRFHQGAEQYAAYLESFEGRLRTDLAFANLEEMVRRLAASKLLSALDVGGGTGGTAIRLARMGLHVTLLDCSEQMLEIAQRNAREQGADHNVTLQLGDATQLASLYPEESFDVILCHNLLEYLEDPMPVLQGAARALRDPSALLSVLVRNQAGEVFKPAILSGDIAGAEKNLTAEWGRESLYGGNVRLFTPESLRTMLGGASLIQTAEYGVRVLADYLPARISRDDAYSQIFNLERHLSARTEFAAVARYTQCFAHRAQLIAEKS